MELEKGDTVQINIDETKLLQKNGEKGTIVRIIGEGVGVVVEVNGEKLHLDTSQIIKK